jgi:NRPS condensation-like uncharacterized protein
LIGARIEQDESGNARFVFDRVPEFRIDVLDKRTDNEWVELAWGEQKKPFDLNKGPLMKFFLLCSSDSTDLVIICHHIICDGLSLTYLVKDIALFLEHPTMKVDTLPLPPALSEDNFSARVSPGWIFRLILRRMDSSWRKEKTVFREDDYARLYEDYWRSRNIGITLLSLSQDLTSALITRCHKEHVTVNSALTAAFTLAQYDLQGRSQKYLRKGVVAVDIRNFLKNPQRENFGLFASVLTVTLPSGKGDLWSTAREFNARIRQLLSNPRKVLEPLALNYLDPTLIDATWFAAYGNLTNRTALRLRKQLLAPIGKPMRSLGITNLGSVGIEKDGNLKSIFFVPVHSDNYEKVIGIVTAGGEMNISLMHDCSRISSETIEDFKQRSIDYIKRAIRA